MDFGYYFKVFLRRLPYFLVLFLLGTAAGITLAVMLPPVYRAEARLVVESEQIPDTLAASTVQTGANEQLQIIQQRIQTREQLLEMANRLGIYADTTRAQMSPDEKVADLRQRIGIAVSSGGGGRRGPALATLVTVSFEAPTGQMAANVVNDLVTQILQQNVEMRTTTAGQTLDFFTQEVQRLDRDLTRQSAELLKFQEENINAMPDSLDFRRSQQAQQQERLLQLQRGEAVLQDRRQRLVSLYENTGRVAETADEGALSPEAQQLAQLKREYAGLLAVLAPTNPKVTVLKNRIDGLEKVVAEQKGVAVEGAEGGALSAYEIQLADIDGQLDFIATQKEQIEQTLASLAETIEQTPGNALRIETMEREFQNTKSLYNQAVANRARAETGDTIESLSKGQRISVLEQAVTPRAPVSPNRPLVAAAGVGGGIALGLGLILLLELMNTSVRRPQDLTAKLGITAFGTIPYIWTAPQLVRRRTTIVGALVVVLVAIPIGLWLVDTQVTPIQPLIGRILDRLNLAGDLPVLVSTRFT